MAQESRLSPSGFPRWSAITLTLVIDVVVALATSNKSPNRVKHIPMRVLKSGETAGVLECGEGAAMAKRTPEQVALKFVSPSLSSYLAWLAMLSGILPVSLAGSPWNHDQLGRVGHGMLRAGMVLGLVAFSGAYSVLCPDCTD